MQRTMWLTKLKATAATKLAAGFIISQPRCAAAAASSAWRCPSFPGQGWFTTTAACLKVQYPPRPKPPPDEEITEVYLKGSGPGGQKINKTSSAVQIKHLPTGIVIKCQETRSRTQNRKRAREHLAEKIDDFLNGENSRSAVVARINARKKASAHKKSRRKHQSADGKGQVEDEDDEGDEGDGDEGKDVVDEQLPESAFQTSGKTEKP